MIHPQCRSTNLYIRRVFISAVNQNSEILKFDQVSKHFMYNERVNNSREEFIRIFVRLFSNPRKYISSFLFILSLVSSREAPVLDSHIKLILPKVIHTRIKPVSFFTLCHFFLPIILLLFRV